MSQLQRGTGLLHCATEPQRPQSSRCPLSPRDTWPSTCGHTSPTPMSVCPAGVQGSQGSVPGLQTGLWEPRSALASCGNGLFPCLLFFHLLIFLRIVATAKPKTESCPSVRVCFAGSYRQQQSHSPRLREITREGAGMCIWQHFVSWPFHCFLCIQGSQRFGHGGPFNPESIGLGLHNRYRLQGSTSHEKLRTAVNKKSPYRLQK